MGLAERLSMTLGELGRRMDVAELREWIARDRIEPPGDPWLQTGVIASVIWNTAGKSTRESRTPSDFLPTTTARRDLSDGPASSAADLARFQAFVAMASARLKTEGNSGP